MRAYTPIEEREDLDGIILLSEQETEAIEISPPRRSPKRSALFMFTLASWSALLTAIAANINARAVAVLFAAITVILYIVGVWCVTCIEEQEVN